MATSGRIGRSGRIRGGLAVVLFVWIGSLHGLLFLSSFADDSHHAVMSATKNQLRVVLHHHEHQEERHAVDHAHDGASAGRSGEVPPDHELSLSHQGQDAATSSAPGAVPMVKAVALAPPETDAASLGPSIPSYQADPERFVLRTTLRSHRTTVLLI